MNLVETIKAHQEKHRDVGHAPDCAIMVANGQPVYSCSGTYVCPRCEGEFGWCTGAWDDTPALCDDCALVVQSDD